MKSVVVSGFVIICTCIGFLVLLHGTTSPSLRAVQYSVIEKQDFMQSLQDKNHFYFDNTFFHLTVCQISPQRVGSRRK